MFTVYLPDGVTVTYEGDAGLPVGQAYRLAWRIRETGYQGAGTATTLEKATAWAKDMSSRGDGIDYWVEQCIWVRV